MCKSWVWRIVRTGKKEEKPFLTQCRCSPMYGEKILIAERDCNFVDRQTNLIFKQVDTLLKKYAACLHDTLYMMAF